MSRSDAPAEAPRRISAWPLLAVGVLLFLAGLAWFAPAIVAGTPLLNHYAAQSVPGFRGRIDLGGGCAGNGERVESFPSIGDSHDARAEEVHRQARRRDVRGAGLKV